MTLTESLNKLDYKTVNEIKELRKEHDFRNIRKLITTNRLEQLLNNLYPKFTLPEIEKIIGVPDSTLEYWFKKLGIPFLRHHASILSFVGNADKKIPTLYNNEIKIVNKIELTDPLAYLIGFTLGDGSVQKYMVEVFNKDPGIKKYLLGVAEQYGTVTKDEREDGLWRLRLSSVKVANLIKNKEIREDSLDYIFNRDELTRYFIAGFWDAEGSVLKYRGRKAPKFNVYLYNSNKALLDRIGYFLKSKRINYSTIMVSGPHKKERIYYYKSNKIIAKKDIYRINIHMDYIIRWINEIGLYLQHSKKSNIVDEILHEKLKLYGN